MGEYPVLMVLVYVNGTKKNLNLKKRKKCCEELKKLNEDCINPKNMEKLVNCISAENNQQLGEGFGFGWNNAIKACLDQNHIKKRPKKIIDIQKKLKPHVDAKNFMDKPNKTFGYDSKTGPKKIFNAQIIFCHIM